MDGIKRVRTVISEENKKLLDGLFVKGMTSKGKKCAEMHREAEQKTSLPKNVILEWIGNRLKKESGREYSYKKTFYRKGLSGYNMFVHENSENLSNIKQWGQKWTNLPNEEKEAYKQKASSIEFNPDVGKAKRALLQDLHKTITDLKKKGVSMSALGVDEEGNQVFVGSGPTGSFFKERPEIHNDLVMYCRAGKEKATGTDEEKKDLGSLRKKVATHMNQLYAKATGKPLPFPYKAVDQGSVVVKGLPQEISPIRFPSHYGRDKLLMLLDCPVVTVEETITLSTEIADVEKIVDSISENSDIRKRKQGEGSTADTVVTSNQQTPLNVKKVKMSPIKIDKEKIECGSNLSSDQVAILSPLLLDPSLQELVDPPEDDLFEIEAVLRERGPKTKKEVLVKWKGFQEPTWILKKEIVDIK